MSLLAEKGEGRDYRDRYVWLLGAALLALLVLAGRLYYLQVVRGDYYADRSRSNFVKRIDLPSDRGMILDRNGTILVDARPSYDVDLTPAFCPDVDGTLDRLARIVDLEPEALEEVRARLAKARGLERFRAVTVRKDVSREALDWLETHLLELDGVDVRVRPQRHYRHGPMLAHVLGYMNEISREELDASREKGLAYRLGDAVGRGGIESRYETELRGRDGYLRQVVDAKGRPSESKLSEDETPLIPAEDRLRESRPGHNLELTIDVRLQQIAEEAFPGQEGAVVAIDPRTGYILAMVSRPSFDPNLMSAGISRDQMRELRENPYKPLLHRAIQAHYPPGSTFKPIPALAALEQEMVTPHSGTVCNGGYKLGRRRWRCWRAAGHGFENLEDSLAHSCDTYYYWLGDRMGLDPMAEMARRFGFGSRTGINLAHEVPGIIPTEAWHEKVSAEGYQRGFALNSAIGQGSVNVTPLQLAVAYAALGNGGTVLRPQLVRRVLSAEGEVIEEFPPEVMRTLDVDPKHLAAVVKGLEAVMHDPGGTGYARRPRNLQVRIAGKSGTAQVVKMGAARVRSQDQEYWTRDHAWFAAFAPSTEPEIAVAVLNEHGGGGSSDAAPTAMAVIDGYFRLKAQDAADLAEAPHAPERRWGVPEGPPPPPALGAVAPPFEFEFAPGFAAPSSEVDPG